MKRTIVILGVILLPVFISCETAKENRQAGQSVTTDSISFPETTQSVIEASTGTDKTVQFESYVDSVDFLSLIVTDVIFDDDFTYNPLDDKYRVKSKVEMKNLLPSIYSLSEDTIVSSRDSNYKYYFLVARSDKNILYFDFSEHYDAYVLSHGIILDSTVDLARGIKIGMAKGDFLKSFGKEAVEGDVVHVDNQDQTSDQIFFFQDDKLVAIKLDDVFGY